MRFKLGMFKLVNSRGGHSLAHASDNSAHAQRYRHPTSCSKSLSHHIVMVVSFTCCSLIPSHPHFYFPHFLSAITLQFIVIFVSNFHSINPLGLTYIIYMKTLGRHVLFYVWFLPPTFPLYTLAFFTIHC